MPPRNAAFALFACLALGAWAVVSAIAHPATAGMTCAEFPLCYVNALAYPERVFAPFSLPALHLLLTAVAKVIAVVWLLASLRGGRRNHAVASPGAAEPVSWEGRRYLPHLLLVLVVLAGHMVHSGESGLPERARHFASVTFAWASSWVFWMGTLRPKGEGNERFLESKGNTAPRRLAMAAGALVTVASVSTALLQFDAGLFPCGEEKLFCYVDETAPRTWIPALGAFLWLQRGMVLTASFAAFAFATWRLIKRERHEALWIPWSTLCWISTAVFTELSFAGVPAFALNQFFGWLLTGLLVGLALRQCNEAGISEIDEIEPRRHRTAESQT
jgi:hypothetical protein